MAGSKNAAILFLISALLLFIQAGISSIALDDWLGGFVSGAFAFVMLMAMLMAFKGGLSAVMNTTTTDGPGYRTITYTDTGQRIQMTPCCGICGGIGIIAVIFMFVGDMLEDYLLAVIPGFIAGFLAILGGIVFAAEYKGPWTGQAY